MRKILTHYIATQKKLFLQKFPFDGQKNKRFNIDNYNLKSKKNNKIIKIKKEKNDLEYDSMCFTLVFNKGLTNSEVIEVASNYGFTASQTSFLYNYITSDIGKDHSMYMQIFYSMMNPRYTYYIDISGTKYSSEVTYIGGSCTCELPSRQA
ncbi:hypothetical protein GOQ29_06955 [Clostridium sp. D2Q-14]|uniref:hypothetical protein n=1 Tax=Anaeromonas gelatinilytica TaxID=2683194 RepID=UPI00193C4C3F|nr:hypothetical protein [Anaeromonas gelatinilytica]MBS4535355.1 hypothetical protein [Anaeromonas gelatinilytica]